MRKNVNVEISKLNIKKQIRNTRNWKQSVHIMYVKRNRNTKGDKLPLVTKVENEKRNIKETERREREREV